ncbi:MAG TPA: cytochrome C oxidase subunit IV family protein [Tepidisphaeraceae bacterium]|jgi:cytochrome c oxidase subunit 4
MRSTPSIFRQQVAGPHGAHSVSEATAEVTAHDHNPHGIGHVVSPLILIGVFAALMVLTIITVAVTAIDLGYKANLIVALAIALVKALLVIAYFMHLRYDSLFYTAIVAGCMIFIAVFIFTTMLDTEQYHPIVQPTPVAPAP